MKQYDAIVIGAGQAGVPLAKKLAKAGKKTALIEKRFVGGTCVNDGCTPTKAMVASAKAAYNAVHSAEVGVTVSSYTVDLKAIKARKDKIVMKSRSGGQSAVEKTEGLDLIFGEASFTAHKTISVKLNDGGEEELTAELFFINTGASPMIPDIEGLEAAGYLTSTTILDLEEVPQHLLIIGGNYIGLEFGQMFSRFGSKVTILERSERLLPREDEDIAQELTKILQQENINILCSTQAKSFDKIGYSITATIERNGETSDIDCTHILVAAGRKPQTERLGLDKTGVEINEKGYIKVNNKLETNVAGIYALGDVTPGPAFTHISYNDYTIVYRNLFEGENFNTDDRPVPYCMFTDPQLGRIGLSEMEAKKQGINYQAVTLPMAHVARAIEVGDTRGIMKAIVDPDSKKILGAAILGEQGGEIMTVLQMAMEGGITYDRIRYCVFAHPTYSESLNNLFMTLEK
ncbi:mercuric reductase [Mucilaginibacter sp. UR6-1]|uniref:mercuric reductase n=1 Tax=Mucilaginibacter sp. UR6-1 TaxID=1435643 RepID=UPI001E464883|nr:mercuric reductase [Mucilaginibacter sp. UR6-1]MCC8410875.1 mercuric reductase [Mucilaginibacter sp. UR6-1]